MPINKEKGAAYLRYRRSIANLTYSTITGATQIPQTTLSAYFNGTVQSPNKETFENLMTAVGGSWEEYDAWSPESAGDSPKAVALDPDTIEHIIAPVRQSLEAALAHAEREHDAEVQRIEAAHEREIARIRSEAADAFRAQKIEKYALFALLIAAIVVILFLKM